MSEQCPNCVETKKRTKEMLSAGYTMLRTKIKDMNDFFNFLRTPMVGIVHAVDDEDEQGMVGIIAVASVAMAALEKTYKQMDGPFENFHNAFLHQYNDIGVQTLDAMRTDHKQESIH